MREKNVMASGEYYVATHILMAWKRLAGLEPDQPHGRSFPDVGDCPLSGVNRLRKQTSCLARTLLSMFSELSLFVISVPA